MIRRSSPLLLAFAVGHAILGAYVLYRGVTSSFRDPWWLAAFLGPLLLANAVGIGLRRSAFDRKFTRGLGMTMRVVGGLALVVGAMAMREDLDGAWPVMAVSLAIAGWGVALVKVVDDASDHFAEP